MATPPLLPCFKTQETNRFGIARIYIAKKKLNQLINTHCWSPSWTIQLKVFEHIHSMSNFGLFFFFVQMSWIFACGLRFNRKSQPCIFFRRFALHFRVKTYAKNSAALFAVCCRTRQAKKPIVFPNNETSEASCSRLFFCIRFYSKMKRKPAEKNTGLWLSIKSETTCKNSAHLDEKKKQTKIRHRMDMPEDLQL